MCSFAPNPHRTCMSEPKSTIHRSRTVPAAGIYQCLAEVLIVNKKGLHARASAAFVKTAEQFDAEVSVTKDGQCVSGGSIMALLMLGAGPGSTILVETEGPEAEEAMEALTALVEARFHEEE
jgi:phosphocarrier protein HPr